MDAVTSYQQLANNNRNQYKPCHPKRRCCRFCVPESNDFYGQPDLHQALNAVAPEGAEIVYRSLSGAFALG
jgi:hypothetical protein